MAELGLILFHGAGGDREHHTFLALEEGLGQAVVGVDRVNFPYRRKGPGRRPPDRMPTLVASVGEAVDEASQRWGIGPDRIVVGGRSMGGRAASMAVAEGLEAAGLVLLSYPLHPPGKPDKLRTEHIDAIACPVLLIQGRRDPFGKPDEFADRFPAPAGPLTEHWIDGNHSPKPEHDDAIVGFVADWLTGLSAQP